MARRPGQRATKFGCKGYRLLRSWSTLLILAEPGPPPTAAEVLARLRSRYPFDGLELSIQTTRDDLRLLRLCGFPVVPLDDAGDEIDLDAFDSLSGRLKNVRWGMRDPRLLREMLCEGLPRPSAADVLTLEVLRSLLGQAAPAGFWLAAILRRLVDELGRMHPPTVRPRVPPWEAGKLIRLRIAGADVTRVRASLPAPSRLVRLCEDGGTLVEFTAPVDGSVEALLLSVADWAVVEEPVELRDRIAVRLATALEAYAGRTAAAVKIVRKLQDQTHKGEEP